MLTRSACANPGLPALTPVCRIYMSVRIRFRSVLGAAVLRSIIPRLVPAPAQWSSRHYASAWPYLRQCLHDDFRNICVRLTCLSRIDPDFPASYSICRRFVEYYCIYLLKKLYHKNRLSIYKKCIQYYCILFFQEGVYPLKLQYFTS